MVRGAPACIPSRDGAICHHQRRVRTTHTPCRYNEAFRHRPIVCVSRAPCSASQFACGLCIHNTRCNTIHRRVTIVLGGAFAYTTTTMASSTHRGGGVGGGILVDNPRYCHTMHHMCAPHPLPHVRGAAPHCMLHMFSAFDICSRAPPIGQARPARWWVARHCRTRARFHNHALPMLHNVVTCATRVSWANGPTGCQGC